MRLYITGNTEVYVDKETDGSKQIGIDFNILPSIRFSYDYCDYKVNEFFKVEDKWWDCVLRFAWLIFECRIVLTSKSKKELRGEENKRFPLDVNEAFK